MGDGAVTRGASADPEELVDRTRPLYRRDSPPGATEAVTTDPVPDQVMFAAQGLLIGSSGSGSRDRLLVVGVDETADGTPEQRRRVPEAS